MELVNEATGYQQFRAREDHFQKSFIAIYLGCAAGSIPLTLTNIAASWHGYLPAAGASIVSWSDRACPGIANSMCPTSRS
jgi:hypothetical protein